MNQEREAEERVLRAINAVKDGIEPDEKCVYCDGRIQVIGSPPGGPYTSFHFTCPCKKTSGFLRGI